jgi:hypothetical protein
MNTASSPQTALDRPNLTAGKVERVPALPSEVPPDSLAAWQERYLAVAVAGLRSLAVAGGFRMTPQKGALHRLPVFAVSRILSEATRLVF